MIRRHGGFASALASLSWLACGAGCRLGTPTEAQATVAPVVLRVKTAELRRARIAAPVRATGVLVHEVEATLAFAVDGVVSRVSVREGDSFRRGDVLARLELATVNADVGTARAMLGRAERGLGRASALASHGATSAQALEDAHTDVDLGRLRLASASFARRHSVLVAESDGIVLARTADPGETVAAGTPVVVVAFAQAAANVRVMVTDREFVRLRPGDAATVALDATPHDVHEGHVLRMAGAVDAATGLYPVEVGIAGLLPPAVAGFVAKVSITPSDATDVTLVPAEAIVEADETTAVVWALAPDGLHASRQVVQIAFLTEGRAALHTRLDSFSRVVTAGSPYLREGSLLEVVPDGAPMPSMNP